MVGPLSDVQIAAFLLEVKIKRQPRNLTRN